MSANCAVIEEVLRSFTEVKVEIPQSENTPITSKSPFYKMLRLKSTEVLSAKCV